jgi:hypothetical protein
MYDIQVPVADGKAYLFLTIFMRETYMLCTHPNYFGWYDNTTINTFFLSIVFTKSTLRTTYCATTLLAPALLEKKVATMVPPPLLSEITPKQDENWRDICKKIIAK